MIDKIDRLLLIALKKNLPKNHLFYPQFLKLNNNLENIKILNFFKTIGIFFESIFNDLSTIQFAKTSFSVLNAMSTFQALENSAMQKKYVVNLVIIRVLCHKKPAERDPPYYKNK